MTDRHMVWACFGVDADSPEQAKQIINKTMSANLLSTADGWDTLELYNKHRINQTVFISPKLDMLFGEGIDDDGTQNN